MEKLKSALEFVEKEWERANKTEDILYKKERLAHETLKKTMDSGILALTTGDAEGFRTHSGGVIEQMQTIYGNMNDFRNELYKYLCVTCDIFSERQKTVSRDSLVSHQEIEKIQTVEELLKYADRIISDIGKHIAADQTGSSHRVILELLEYINAHYNEDIGLNELADRAKMSTAYLSVLFKTEVGTSYVKYLTDLRIRQAKKYLKDGYRVNEVSEMVGYSNYRYFCDIFKKHEGKTPSEYKANVWKTGKE